jgi:hypothetical protein
MLSPIRIGADYTPIVWFTIGVRVRTPRSTVSRSL